MRASPEPPPSALADLLLALPGVGTDPAVAGAVRAVAAAGDAGDTGASLAELAAAVGIAAASLAARLRASGLAATAGDGEPTAPLVIDGDHLASRRAWRHERGLARLLAGRAGRNRLDECRADPGLAAAVAAAFPVDAAGRARSEGGVHWQRLAACAALASGLAVVTGGPGTGKTTVAAAVVGLLAGHRARRGQTAPRTVLAAPTAKAAQRLAEAVRADLGPERAALAGWTSTLHRLAGDPQAAQADLAVIDEASMADLAILHRALAALPPDCRVLLLGDPDQLASVEPGRVLGEVAARSTGAIAADLAAWHAACGGAGEPVAVAKDGHPLARAQVRLRVNWRSGDAPPLAGLVRDLQDGAIAAAVARLEAPAASDAWCRREPLPPAPRPLVEILAREHAAWADALLDTADADAALAGFDRLRLLAALRRGPWGSDGLNATWEAALLRRRGIAADPLGNYPGRPVLVTRNRRDLGLDNGSVGVVREAGGVLVARFAGRADAVPLHRLDGLVPAWFLTVHKAQGSQGDQVELVGVPPDADGAAALASRELVYTGITRARRRVRLWWDATGLRAVLARRGQRHSGLGLHLDRLAPG